MEQLARLDTVLRDYLKPLTWPLAVKLLPPGGEIPPKFKRPSETFGYAVGLCQGFGLARRYGWSMAFGLADMACGPSLSYFGFIGIPEFQREGGLAHPMYAKTPEGGRRSEERIDRLEPGRVETILITPLNRPAFEPDLVLIYGNAAQMSRLVQGALYVRGGAVDAVVAGRCACTAEVITPLQKNDYNFILPDGGERIFALTADDELAFAVPAGLIDELIEGLTVTHKSGVARYPYPVQGLRGQPAFPEKYEPLVAAAKAKIGA